MGRHFNKDIGRISESLGMRIAYVSHVDSRWIKQRPHFIAESMQKMGESVTYICSSLVRSELLVKNQSLSVPVVRVPMLPQRFRKRLGILGPFLSVVSALIILLRVRPQVVFVTHARHHMLARLLRVSRVRVFYDCMDLNGLFSDATITDSDDERKLVEVSERVFCSSDPIATHIRSIVPEARVSVVPNALNDAAFLSYEPGTGSYTPKTVGYVGAVSSWFDFSAILALLDSKPDLSVRLWGPCDVTVPEHDRLKYLGILSHNEAIMAMRSCAVLVLPFHVTDLIRAVDPVKVYEYIATGRPVIASDYPQLAHFGSWIRRYSSAGHLIRHVEELVDAPTLAADDLREFVVANSWTVRTEKMLEKVG